MSDNPYQAPSEPVQVKGIISGQKEDLRNVAVYQRGMIICILLNIVLYIAMLATGLQLLQIAFAILAIVQLVFVFGLARRTCNLVSAIILTVLALFPCIGLMILFIVNQRATKVLQENGIPVGFLGVNVSKHDWS